MDRSEATLVLRDELSKLARRSRSDLVKGVGQVEAYEVPGPGPAGYQVELDVMWDGEPGGTLRALGSIDDGGLRSSFKPVEDGFLMHVDGTIEMDDLDAGD